MLNCQIALSNLQEITGAVFFLAFSKQKNWTNSERFAATKNLFFSKWLLN